MGRVKLYWADYIIRIIDNMSSARDKDSDFPAIKKLLSDPCFRNNFISAGQWRIESTNKSHEEVSLLISGNKFTLNKWRKEAMSKTMKHHIKLFETGWRLRITSVIRSKTSISKYNINSYHNSKVYFFDFLETKEDLKSERRAKNLASRSTTRIVRPRHSLFDISINPQKTTQLLTKKKPAIPTIHLEGEKDVKR